MPELKDPERRVVVSVDMESYSRRNNVLQLRAQEAFKRVMDDAAVATGLDRVHWIIQQGGDGELGILPPGSSERAVLGLVPALDGRLRDYNQGLLPEARVRLRIAVHQGLVHLEGANGFPSQEGVHVSRLIDAPPLKKALRDFPGANVALIVSDSIYREVVEPYRDLRPEQFARVQVEMPEKDFRAPGWIYVPGENIGDGIRPKAEPIDPVAAERPPAAPSGGQVFSGITTYGAATFGNHNTQHNG